MTRRRVYVKCGQNRRTLRTILANRRYQASPDSLLLMRRQHLQFSDLKRVLEPGKRCFATTGLPETAVDRVVPPLAGRAVKSIAETDQPAVLERENRREPGIGQVPLDDRSPSPDLVGWGFHGGRVDGQNRIEPVPKLATVGRPQRAGLTHPGEPTRGAITRRTDRRSPGRKRIRTRLLTTLGWAATITAGLVLMSACGTSSSPVTVPAEAARQHSSPDSARGPKPAEPPGSTPSAEPNENGGRPSDRKPKPAKPVERLPRLSIGSEGPLVASIQAKLQALHYDPGPVDGSFGSATRDAVYAFQKVHGLDPEPVIGPHTWSALRDPRTPAPLVRDRAPNRVEIDLAHQLLYVYTAGRLGLISHVSSGSGETFCTDTCRQAVTPTGDYRTDWRVTGWRVSDLGSLYNPVYFNGGIAVHGSYSVPTYPASHGCVRIPMGTAEVFPRIVGEGWPVLVRDPPRAAPALLQAPNDSPPERLGRPMPA